MTTMVRQYIVLPERALGGAGPSVPWEQREQWWDVSKGLLGVVLGLERLSTLFGLPASRPKFFIWAEALPPEFVAKAEALGFVDGTWVEGDLNGWTPAGEPSVHYIGLKERCDGSGCGERGHSLGFHVRPGEEIYKSAVHEFGHRLQLEEIADWPYDLADGRCSSEVVRFADFVSKQSSGSYVYLNDVHGRGYGSLAEACRLKHGLSPRPTAAELGMGVIQAGVVVPA